MTLRCLETAYSWRVSACYENRNHRMYLLEHSASRTENALKRINPRNALPDDQRMHVVCAFVGFHRLQVHHVAHDGIVVGHAVGAEDVAREAGAHKRATGRFLFVHLAWAWARSFSAH